MATFLLNDFADLVSFSSDSIEFHIFGNKAEGKHSRVLKRTRSSSGFRSRYIQGSGPGIYRVQVQLYTGFRSRYIQGSGTGIYKVQVQVYTGFRSRYIQGSGPEIVSPYGREIQ